MSTIPDNYRQWAKSEAEREYPMPEADTQRRCYEAALLRMWPVVEAASKMLWPNVVSADDLALWGMASAGSAKSVKTVREIVTDYRNAQDGLREALTTLNLPR